MVVCAPVAKQVAGLAGLRESRFVKAVFSELADEALRSGILLQLPGLDILPVDTFLLSPARYQHGVEFAWESSNAFHRGFMELKGDGASQQNRCVYHGLRKVAARRLAEAGRSANELAAVTGHATLPGGLWKYQDSSAAKVGALSRPAAYIAAFLIPYSQPASTGLGKSLKTS